jgi:hypothetical protein
MKDHFPRMTTPTDSHHEDIMKSNSLWLCVAALLFATQTVHAQVITNGEIERGLRYRGTSYDGEPYTQRYSYGLNLAPIYLNGSSQRLNYLNYLDKADRATKFGYRMPINPYFEEPIEDEPVAEPVAVPVRGHVGFGGWGFWRRR